MFPVVLLSLSPPLPFSLSPPLLLFRCDDGQGQIGAASADDEKRIIHKGLGGIPQAFAFKRTLYVLAASGRVFPCGVGENADGLIVEGKPLADLERTDIKSVALRFQFPFFSRAVVAGDHNDEYRRLGRGQQFRRDAHGLTVFDKAWFQPRSGEGEQFTLNG